METPSTVLDLQPEQQDTSRMISDLLGPALALRYEDFCRLSAGALALNASKPMAAHAVRELDSMLRGILAVPMEAVPHEDKNQKAKERCARKYLRGIGYDENVIDSAIRGLAPRTSHKNQIQKIVERLGFDPSGDIAVKWVSTINNYQIAHGGRSFRDPSKVDNHFRTTIQQPFDTVVREIMTSLRSNYAALMRRVKALAAMTDRGHAVRLFAKEIPGAMQLQWFFYQSLTTGDWLPELIQAGLLGEPPRVAEEGEGGRHYGEWPAGNYLLRMARSDDQETRKLVVEVLQSVEDASHPDILREGIEIIAALPASEAALISDLAVGWLRQDERELHAQAPNDLIRKLADGGQSEGALRVARELFRLWGDNGQIKSHYGEYMYEHHLPILASPLTAACGRGALDFLIDCLSQAVLISGKSDYRHFSRQLISHINLPPLDVFDVLIPAVYQSAEQLTKQGDLTMSEAVDALSTKKERLFIRLALNLLAESPGSAPQHATSYLLDDSLITSDWCNYEYAALATAWFPALSPEQQIKIFNAIDDVPGKYLEPWKIRFQEQNHRKPDLEDINKFTASCTCDLLWKWRSVLPLDRREAVEKAGDPDAWLSPLRLSDESPMSDQELMGKSVDEVVAFLKGWQPVERPSRFSVSALAQVLRETATLQHELYSAEADKFADLRPLYVRRMIEGLQQAAANQKKVSWEKILVLLRSTYSKRSNLIVSDAISMGHDPTWEWACRSASELLLTGLRLGSTGIGIEHRSSVWALVASSWTLAAFDEYEKFDEEFARNPYFAAQKTDCGAVTEFCILFARWLNMNSGAKGRGSATAISDNSELEAVLESQLSDRSAKGRIPRAVLGRYLRVLEITDSNWMKAHMRALLPGDNNALCQATWLSHLLNDGGPIHTLLPELSECYAEEILRLSDGLQVVEQDFRQQRLCEYIMVLVLRGTVPQPLLDQFTKNASSQMLRQALQFVGRQVSLPAAELPGHMVERGLKYWESRLAAAQAAADPTTYRSELGVIDQWCFLGALDELWLSDQLMAMNSIGVMPSKAFYTIQWLKKLSINHVDRAVTILFGLIQHSNRNRFIYMGNNEAIRFILGEGRTRGTPTILDLVSKIVSNLASMGEYGYLDLDIVRSTPSQT